MFSLTPGDGISCARHPHVKIAGWPARSNTLWTLTGRHAAQKDLLVGNDGIAA
jgi:hypothetical protein